jgi:hypothetical protein
MRSHDRGNDLAWAEDSLTIHRTTENAEVDRC